MEKAVGIISKGISVIFHPLLIPVYIIWVIFFSPSSPFMTTPSIVKNYILALTLIFLIFLPLVSIMGFKYAGLIGDVKLDMREDRIYPIMAGIFFVFVALFLSKNTAHVQIVRLMYLSFIVLLSLGSLITLFWKISFHAGGMGILCGYILFLSYRYHCDFRSVYITFLFAAGLVGAARLYLGQHSLAQVGCGFLLGHVILLLLLF